MIKNKKQMFIVIGAFALVILVGITYAFFNYTRTGSPNTIKTGRIYFNTTENGTLNLTNVFPMSSTAAGNANLSEVSVRIQGDTTYSSGEEYEITIVGVNNTVNSKTIPINYIATYAITDDENDQTDEIGTMDNSTYFTTRGSTTAVYKLNATGEAVNGEQVLVGYIPANGAIDGTLKIKAYLDSANIAISDTYPEGTTYTVKSSLGEADITACEAALDGVTDVENICDTSAHLQAAIDAGNVISLAQITALENAEIVTEYTDGTLSTWVAGREVLTTEEWNSLQNAQNPLSFKIKAEANEGVWVDSVRKFAKLNSAIEAKKVAEENSCNPIWVDNMGTSSDKTDDITYFTGNSTCVDMNYVSYSGKLWRIVAIYPDGKMKLVTQENVDSMAWGNSVEYDGSTIYQWLNEDFYSTLVNPSNYIVSSTWNYSVNSVVPVRTETIETQQTKTAQVGLLNVYEYYNSYRCINSETCEGHLFTSSYLKNGNNWWLITPYSSSQVRYVTNTGNPVNDIFSATYGVRPSIVLKSGISLSSGSGTSTDPFVLS